MGTFRFYDCDAEHTSLLTLTFSFNFLDIVLLSLSVQVGIVEYQKQPNIEKKPRLMS